MRSSNIKFKLFFIIAALFSFSTITISAPLMEEAAIKKAADDIYTNGSKLKGKKLTVYAFTNLDGKETPEGKRVSNKILSRLILKKDLKFVERAEIDKIIKEQEIQQTGLIDSESIQESGQVLPVDVMINGTLVENKGIGELHVKAVDVNSGEIYSFTSVDFKPGSAFTYTENQEKLKQFKKAPERYEKVNNSIAAINNISMKGPVAFLIITMNDNDVERIKADSPKLMKQINNRKDFIKNNDKRWKNLMRLKENLKLIKEDSPEEYAKIMQKKEEFITKGIEKKGKKR